MRLAPFSRWRNWERFAVSGEFYSTRTRCNGSARSRLRTFTNSMPTWFPSARTNFTGRRARELCLSNRRLLPDPILFGGGHENERRAGTENMAGIIGLVEAMERFVTNPVFSREKLPPLTNRLMALVDSMPRVNWLGRGKKIDKYSVASRGRPPDRWKRSWGVGDARSAVSGSGATMDAGVGRNGSGVQIAFHSANAATSAGLNWRAEQLAPRAAESPCSQRSACRSSGRRHRP